MIDMTERVRSDKPTPRQLEILHLLSYGMSDANIAASLGISTKTVRAHVFSASHKLGVHTRGHAIACCMRRGWFA